ncbi:MAG TPA: DUF512 domain-containing protein [Nitrospirota bacterium]
MKEYEKMKGMKLSGVEEGGTAWEVGIEKGDEILEINGREVPDWLAYRYLIAEEEVTVLVRKKDGSLEEIEFEKDEEDDLGLEPPPIKVSRCGNKCVFCFVDQMPKGLRKTLYVKDEDFRHSFLYGNYITLTSLKDKDYDRIIEERLSPLYISVHATDDALRRCLLGRKTAPSIVDSIQRLTDGGITVHTQAVVCPGLNDGPVLAKTIEDLARLRPHAASLAIVPIGLTRHREGLPQLRGFTKKEAAALLDLIAPYQKKFRKETGLAFAYASDEFYIKAGRPVPPEKEYDGYPQLDNGVGLVRDFLEEFRHESRRLPKKLAAPKKAILLTGVSFAPFLSEVSKRLDKIDGLSVKVLAAKNGLFGESVTVTGLLSGRDIIAALKGRKADAVIIPTIAVRDGYGVFLDDLTPEDIVRETGITVIMTEPTANGLIEAVKQI